MAPKTAGRTTGQIDSIESVLGNHPGKLLEAGRRLGESRWASFTRACCVLHLFDGAERIFASKEEPTAAINKLMEQLTAFLESAVENGVNNLGKNRLRTGDGEENDAAIESATGEHYGRLFRAFSQPSFWDEPAALLRARLKRNDVDLSKISEMEVLDAGCGGGRYTVAWRLLGAKRVVGVDISSIGIANARERVKEGGFDGVVFKKGSVLALPFTDDSFDVAFSNGVLHHTLDWKKGIAELVRVLKPGGLGWLYLIENPGGLFWAVIEILRELMKEEDREFARASLQLLGVSANRIFYMLDHVMVPINLRLTPAEIEQCLTECGATKIRRLKRGADFDRVEQIYQQEPYADIKYGVGENRYVFSKG